MMYHSIPIGYGNVKTLTDTVRITFPISSKSVSISLKSLSFPTVYAQLQG